MIRKLRIRMTLLVIGVLVIVSIGIVVGIYEVNNRNIIAQAEAALEALSDSGEEPPEIPREEDGTPPPKPEERDGGEGGPGGGGETPPPKPEERDGTGETGETPFAGPEERDAAESGAPGGSETATGDENQTLRPDPPGGDNRPGSAPPGMDPGGPGQNRDRGMSGAEVASLSNSYTLELDSEGQITSWESDRENLYQQDDLQVFADQVLSEGQDSGRIGSQFYSLKQTESGSRLTVLDARLEMMAGQRVLRTTSLVAGIACLVLSLGAWALIRRMVRPVEEAFIKQQQFVWDASHELKTPLAVISANADLLESEIGTHENLTYIQSEVHRTDALVKNLLTLARMDRGTAGQEKTDVHLSEAVLGVLLPFESTVFEAGKTLESDIQEDVHCHGNEAMLQQLTVILLSNALKYSNPQGTIRVILKKKNRGCELRVENTGDGIAPRDLERIFDRFYRADRSRNSETGGEGLGLAIARSITEIHHGKIRAESEADGWTKFIVELG